MFPPVAITLADARARYSDDFQPQREFEPDEHTRLLYHFDANGKNIIYDHSGHKNHVMVDGIQWVDQQTAAE